MSKQDQVLIIEPQHELKFISSAFPITSYIKLVNPTESTVAFKIKTTAPKKYCVRPNSGVLTPNASSKIAVSLQSLDFDQSEKNKHKFMVQTMFVPDDTWLPDLDTLWKDAKDDAIMGTKLKCVFENMEKKDEVLAGSNVELSNPNIPVSAPTSHEEKTKRIGDSPSVHRQDGELQKAAKEVKQLQEDESSLRHENMRLREEIVKLQLLCNQGQSAQMRSVSSAVQQAQPVQPLMVIIAIVVGMVGIVLGKFIL